MPIRLACPDFTFPLLKHGDSLKLISMMGFEAADIGLFEDRSHLYPSREFKNIPVNAGELKKKLEYAGLKLADVFLQNALDFTSVAINHPDAGVRAESRESFMKLIEYTLVAGGHHVCILPGVLFPDIEDRQTSFERSARELEWRICEAKKNNVAFSVEAHIGSLIENPETALELLMAVPDLRLALDFSHFARQGIADEQVYPLLPYANHVHFRGAKPGVLQTVVKESSVNFKEIIHRLMNLRYDGYIVLEYTWTEWENCNRTDNLSETILLKNLIEDTLKAGNDAR